MKGLLYKDALLLVRQYKIFLLVSIGFTVAGAWLQNSFWTIYGVFFINVLSTSSIQIDDQMKWFSYCECLPLSRKTIVSEKYVFALMSSGGIILLHIIMSVIAGLVNGSMNMEWIGLTSMTMYLFTVVITIGTIPLNMYFGSQKGMLARYVIIALVVCMAVVMMNLSDQVYQVFQNTSGTGAAVAAVVLAALVYAGAWILTIKLYEKKEIV